MMTRRIGFRIENNLSCFAFRIPKSSFGAAASLTRPAINPVYRRAFGSRFASKTIVVACESGPASALIEGWASSHEL